MNDENYPGHSENPWADGWRVFENRRQCPEKTVQIYLTTPVSDQRLMDDRPGWIQLLYKRSSVWATLHTAFLLDSDSQFIADEADVQPDGRNRLRQVALEELESNDLQFTAISLVCLSVVGKPEDLPIVEPFIAHPSDLIRRAAAVCRFELARLEKSAKISGESDTCSMSDCP